MKIYSINPFSQSFKGKREDRKTVAQLKENNPYSLNKINQRRINTAIESLSEVSGEENASFLLDIAENLKYQTNIDLGKSQFNDWQFKLNSAIQKSLAKSSPDVQSKYAQRISKLQEQKSLTEDEKKMLELRSSILSQVDYGQLEKIESKNIKQLERNLDYFIISSEVTTAQKLYILEKLNHFISPEYKINPQLEDKKTQALAEIVNDITVDTPESKIPNIKSVNQQSHGMCAAISICRKALAYEDKVNYVDIIMSELDANPYMMVYDISKLGSGTKVPISKTRLDFNYALSKGYRIIDTSALYWMNIANTAGSSNEFVGMYSSFDKEDFDTFHDSHLMPNLPTKELEQKQDYYRTLLKAKEAVGNYKKQAEKLKNSSLENIHKSRTNPSLVAKYNAVLSDILSEISPNSSSAEIKNVLNDLLTLEVKTSSKADKVNNYTRDFVYLPNESQKAKVEKIQAFLSIALPDKNSEKLKENALKVFELLQGINGLNQDNSRSYQSRVYARAHGLYEAAATYRTQYVYSLDIPEILDEMTVDCKIPDRETRISKNIDMLIKKLEKGTLNPKIREELAKNLGTENDTEILIEALKTNKETFDYLMTVMMDSLYNSITLGSRKEALLQDINVVKGAIKNGETYVLSVISTNLGVKDDKRKVLDILDRYIKLLENKNCTNEQYLEIYNAVGKKNQMQDFKEKFEELCKILSDDSNREEILAKFKEIHNLPEDASLQDVSQILQNISNTFNEVSKVSTLFQQMLEARGEDGTILNTVMAKPIVLKKLENAGVIIPERDLKLLQERFSKISKARTNINGEEVELKDLPAELFIFSKHEKEVLKHIEKSINQWNSSISKALRNQYLELKEPLNELHREVGYKKGEKYVSEGSSGLDSTQQIRIFEYMTDRPYYAENNGSVAISKIKNSPYSGISCTSVDHKHPAWHAQYIADIKPVAIKTSNGTETKEALFHDNSWGPTEHANTWVDEAGLTRTDYEREYGGSLGYITDDKYLNGKLVENLHGEIGKTRFNDDTDEYRFAMHYDTIVAGKSPLANSYVKRLRETTLINPLRDFEDFEKLVSSKTRPEILEVINKTKYIGQTAVDDYIKIQRRVFGKSPFYAGIQTKEAYDKLSDNDELKILFEKIALLKSYNQIPDEKIFFKHSTMEDLKKNKELIRIEARKNFNYAFGKNPEIVKYGVESIRPDATKLLKDFAIQNNIKLEDKQIITLINSLKKIDKSRFDGSLDTTVQLMSESFANTLSVKFPNLDNKDEKITDLANNVRDMLRDNLGFTLADLNDSSSKKKKLPQNIINWVDRVMEPYSDEEFVQIFNRLQNMTTEEFDRIYGDKIDDEALNIRPISGFDILKQFLTMDSKTEDTLFSMLYYQDYEYNVKMGETESVYDYNKFGKILRGSFYKNERTLDDLYLDYYYSLLLLTLPNRQYKPVQEQLFKNQGIFLAYPKVDFEEEKEEETLIKNLYSNFEDSMESIEICKEKDVTYKTISNVYKYIWKKSPQDIPTASERRYINSRISKIVTTYGEDESIADTIKAGQEILAQDDSTTYETYQKLISVMYDEMSLYITSLDGKSMMDTVKDEIESIEKCKTEFVMNVFAPKHQGKAYELLNKYIKARAKNKDNASEIFGEIEDFIRKYRLLKKPEQMLNEYMLLLAKPTKDDKTRPYSSLETKQLEDVKKVYQTNLKGNLMISNLLDLQYIIMDCAKEGNLNIVRDELKNSQIQLNDGRIVSLDSDLGLSIILEPIMQGLDTKTIKTFIEQLGLSERVIEVYTKNLKTENIRSLIKRIDSILTSVNSQLKFIKKETAKLENIDDDTNYEEKLEELKQNIKQKINRTNYRKSNKFVDAAFSDLLKEIKKHPQHSKATLLNLYMDELKQGMIYLSSADVANKNNELKAYQSYINLLRELQLPPNSPAIQVRDEYLEKIKAVEEFAQKHTKQYAEMQLHTENSDNI